MADFYSATPNRTLTERLLEQERQRLRNSSGRSGHWDDPANRKIREIEKELGKR